MNQKEERRDWDPLDWFEVLRLVVEFVATSIWNDWIGWTGWWDWIFFLMIREQCYRTLYQILSWACSPSCSMGQLIIRLISYCVAKHIRCNIPFMEGVETPFLGLLRRWTTTRKISFRNSLSLFPLGACRKITLHYFLISQWLLKFFICDLIYVASDINTATWKFIRCMFCKLLIVQKHKAKF